jgi:acylphosphatase
MKLKGKVLGTKVHDVGYRVFLLRKAMELGIERFSALNITENGLQTVIFYTEASDDALMTFQSFVDQNHPEHAEVSDITFEDYSGYVMGILDYLHLFQAEQLSKGIPAILDIKDNTQKMLEKQDVMIGKLDDTRREIVGEIREMRGELRSYLDNRFIKIEYDIAEIKAKIGLS